MRARSLTFVFAGLLVACNKNEEAHSSSDAQAAPNETAHVSSPSADQDALERAKAAAGQRSGCVVPMAEEPARRAPKALHCPVDPDAPPPLAHGYVQFEQAPGSPRLDVELARSEAEKERGLMYRTELPDAQGMLFSWGGNEEPRTFWMHNTCIPLDMLFIARDGTITGILEQVPTLNDEARGIPCPAAYVLEVNAGFCRSHGVRSGTRVRIE